MQDLQTSSIYFPCSQICGMTRIALYWASGSLGLIENYRLGSLLFHLALHSPWTSNNEWYIHDKSQNAGLSLELALALPLTFY